MYIHGIGVFPTDNDDSLYLVTHNGLFKKDEWSLSNWIEVGTVKSVMIFSTPSVFGIISALIFLKEHMEIWKLLSSLVLIMVGILLITKNNYEDKTANIHR